jgi:hypothetical protein
MALGNEEAAKEHVRQAKLAVKMGNYLAAYEELGHVDPSSQYAEEVKNLREKIREIEQADLKDASRAPWAGFGVGVLLYLLLSIRTPTQWTGPVWIALAFFVIPIIAGYFTAWYYGFRCDRGERFVPAALAGGLAMVVYSIINLLVARYRIAEGAGSDVGGQYLAELIVTVAYGLIAAIVAGLAGAARPYTVSPDDEDLSTETSGS